MSKNKDQDKELINKKNKNNISSNFIGLKIDNNIPINKIAIGFFTPQKDPKEKLSLNNKIKRENSLNKYDNFICKSLANAYPLQANIDLSSKTNQNEINSTEKFRKEMKKNFLRKIKPLNNLPKILKSSENPTKLFSMEQTFLDRTATNKNKTIKNSDSVNKSEIIISDPNNKKCNTDFMNTKNIKFRKMSGIKKKVNINVINYDNISIPNENSTLFNKIERKTSSSESRYESEKKREIPNIERIMKDKFYEDTENRMMKRMKIKNFSIDTSVKDRIIEINKIKEFWGSFLNYCNPLLLNKRLSCIKEKYERQKKEINRAYKKEELPQIKIKKTKCPMLYTLSSTLEYKHEKQKEIENIEKKNEQVKYYIY